jgi:hypothetical protein
MVKKAEGNIMRAETMPCLNGVILYDYPGGSGSPVWLRIFLNDL